jgi:two-component system LytT family sensor kinase
MMRSARRDDRAASSRGAGTATRTAVLRAAVVAEDAAQQAGSVRGVAEQARVLAGAASCWLVPASGDEARTGTRGEDAVARSLAHACLEDGRTRTRGDLVAVRGVGVAGEFGLVLRFDGATEEAAALTEVVAGWVAHRLRDLARSEQDGRAARAELRALRAQMSPHFTFNALGAIAATLRFDPDRARELLLGFADYTRYSFGRHGDYTTLAEELRAVETYLALERARFGDRLRTAVLVPPELLGISLPFLVLQPLVENAVRHGVEATTGGGTVTVTGHDETHFVRLEVEDDGPGMDPTVLEDRLSGGVPEAARSGFGLRSVDERLRAVYGDSHGLVVETAPGAGTKVCLRIPKYHPEVHQ